MAHNIVLEKGDRIVLPEWVDDEEWIFECKKTNGRSCFWLTNTRLRQVAYGNTSDSPYNQAEQLRKMIETIYS